MPTISILIPIYNEENYIANCIDSILQSDYDKSSMEVILIDGGSSDKTLEIIHKYQNKYNFIKLLNNEKKIVPIAMNLGIKESIGDYIIRLDAHATYPKDYFSKLIEYHQKLDADNIGSIIMTNVKNKTKISSAIRNVLSDKLGVGSSFRTGIDKIKEVDTVPFGCFKRETFKKFGVYNEKLARNQDIELNKRIKNGGGKIYIIPEIQCTYYARETFFDFMKNNFNNGRWNILTPFYTNTINSLSLRHFIPMLFVFWLFFSLCCCTFISLITLSTYLFIVILRSYKIKKDTTLFMQVMAFIILHFSYGFGSVYGILKVIKLYFQS